MSGPIDPTSQVLAIGGAAGALGRAAAERFAAEGRNLALFARATHEPGLRERFPSALVVGADLAEPEQAERAVRAAEERFGGIDALLNLTGAFAPTGALELSAAELAALLTANLSTAVFTTRAALPRMLERGNGFVLGVAAAQAIRGGRRATAYAAAKGAVLGYFRSLRSDVGGRGIGVSVLVPMGTIDTPQNRSAMPDVDPSGWLDLAEVVDAIAFLASRGPRGRVPELRVTVG